MPQSLTQKVVNTFVKGLITEAGELTFPENASVDELNCDLRRDGSRRRRLAAKVEDSRVLSSFTVSTSTRFHTGKWENVGGQSGLEFLVLQVGSTLRFYNKSNLPYSSHEIAETVDLSTYEVAGGVGAANAVMPGYQSPQYPMTPVYPQATPVKSASKGKGLTIPAWSWDFPTLWQFIQRNGLATGAVATLLGLLRKWGPTAMTALWGAGVVADLIGYQTKHKRRRMNPANSKALRRSLRRLHSFERLSTRVSQQLSSPCRRKRREVCP